MKDALGHGSNGTHASGINKLPSKHKPLPGHSYHFKTNDELRYIAKDAHEAAQAMRGHDAAAEGKYLDQVNDAHTVLGYRERTGAGPDQKPTVHDGSKYYSRVSAKNGNKLGEYGPHETREAAAAEAFAKHPKAKSVSTQRGFGMDIRWHNR